MDKCNILFIMADQFRADGLACVGGYGRSDALDQLAAEGTLFRHAQTNSPECIPARFALATGLYPHQTGIWRNNPHTLSPEAPNWTRVLAEAGYRTSLFGKTHFHESAHESNDLRDGLALMHAYGLMDVDEISGPLALQKLLCNMTEGWTAAGLLDVFRKDIAERQQNAPYVASPSPLGVENYYDTYVGQAAAAYLASYQSDDPWFCWVSFAGPHAPWDAPEPYASMHDPATAPPPIPAYSHDDHLEGLLAPRVKKSAEHAPMTDADIAAMRANYAGNITLIDEQIARIIATVKNRGDYENTLIVFTSDHGEMNGDHGLIYKSNFLAPAMDIPLIIRPPGPARPARRGDALVELFDVGATILDYAGCRKPAGSNAISVRPVVDGKTEIHRPFVLAEFGHYNHSMIADQRWKVEFGPAGVVKLLFDRVQDPDELNNLAGQPGTEEIVAELRGLWQTRRSESDTTWKIDL